MTIIIVSKTFREKHELLKKFTTEKQAKDTGTRHVFMQTELPAFHLKSTGTNSDRARCSGSAFLSLDEGSKSTCDRFSSSDSAAEISENSKAANSVTAPIFNGSPSLYR